MTQEKFVAKLRKFVQEKRGNPDQRELADLLADYFEQNDFSGGDQSWRLDDNLPQLVLHALHDMRTGSQSEVVSPLELLEHRVAPRALSFSIKDASTPSKKASERFLREVASMLAQVTQNPNLEHELMALFNAELNVLKLALYRFMAQVYNNGLAEIVGAHKAEDMSGRFGETILGSLPHEGIEAHPTSLRFMRMRRDGNGVGPLVWVHLSEGNPAGFARLGIVLTDFITALEMLRDVTEGWPDNKEDQVKAFVPEGRAA